MLECGASPGGWTQLLASTLGPNGFVVAVDLKSMEPIEETNTAPVVLLAPMDLRAEGTLERVRVVLENRRVDGVLSDMAPSLTGQRDADHLQSIVSLFRDIG